MKFTIIDLDSIYPIGAIYLSTSNANPETFLGGGWRLIEGRTLIGSGNVTDINSTNRTFTLGEEGGELQHTLTIDEIPSHNHGTKELVGSFSLTGTSSSLPWMSASGIVSVKGTTSGKGIEPAGTHSGIGTGWNIDASHTHDFQGNNQPHNLLPPYLVVNIWERVS